jgi:hypothetical protein
MASLSMLNAGLGFTETLQFSRVFPDLDEELIKIGC